MNTNTIRKFKWFWAWQDEQEETWLSEMAEQGFHLERITLPGFFYFQIGEPESFIYRLDYQALRSKDKESYLQLFADAGWEHVGDMSSWVIFRRKVQPGDTPDIYSDVESKIGKYQRNITYLVIFLPILIIFMTNSSNRYGWLSFVMALFILLYAYTMIQLFRRISQLKTKR